MAIQVALSHFTKYHYDRFVKLSPQLVRLRPAPHCRTPIHSYSLTVKPENHFVNWQQDPFGNYVARLVFPEKTQEFSVEVGLVADMVVINPFDFYLDEYAEQYPFNYNKQLQKDLRPYLEIKEKGPQLKNFLNSISRSPCHIVNFLVQLTQTVQQSVEYIVRMEPGIQKCEETLTTKFGSCRDSAWLLVQILRHLGLASRFVSGYLVQLTADVSSIDGPSGPVDDFTDLHAWAEIYIPGAGWLGLDATSGLFAGEGHIPLSCTPDPSSAAPITGEVDPCEVTFSFHNKIQRIHEDPRVTKPYNDAQWQQIYQLGLTIDEQLNKNKVNLTIGGEPTFISIDDFDDPQWNTTALGLEKWERSLDLLQRLQQQFAPQGVCFLSQGKWYPGEPLPRWALSLFWREDEVPLWKISEFNALFGNKTEASPYDAEKLVHAIATSLAIDTEYCMAAYEDPYYRAWKEQLSTNIKEPAQHELSTIGYVLPLNYDDGWYSVRWSLAREQLYLIPGDSPIGYRLPLDEIDKLNGEPELDFPLDPFAPHPELTVPILPNARLKHIYESDKKKRSQSFRTALCVEIRNKTLHLFMPPLLKVEQWIALLNIVEKCVKQLKFSIVLEGYEPPTDPRIHKLQITPDPGVIEVNIHPSRNWQEIVEKTDTLYTQARLARLTTEKFMLDGRHTGTGGGNHVTLGGPNATLSPLLRRPSLLQSLITYWQHHPALSYLFSGSFIGPTSQAPRVDEARDDNLYELEIAFQQLPDGESHQPWLVDRALRHLLVDISGNTHRAEFCIDKLYSPDSIAGRLGLLELRAFEMPPHWQMSAVQALLLRNLVAWFWQRPYRKPLIRWGTQLHNQFMLPYFIERDLLSVVANLNEHHYAWKPEWFAPFLEFRFPVVGRVEVANGMTLELRTALEPWHVLGEEVSSLGTARFVDSSVERLQIRVSGYQDERYVVTCNHRRLPLKSTNLAGEYISGLRFKAWQQSSGLHPVIPMHTPLKFDVVDTKNNCSIGGCVYHAGHPGGRNYETFPVNANEAEARRGARFWTHSHTPGDFAIRDTRMPDESLFTLDMRYQHSE